MVMRTVDRTIRKLSLMKTFYPNFEIAVLACFYENSGHGHELCFLSFSLSLSLSLLP